jgi:hypothetical protein
VRAIAACALLVGCAAAGRPTQLRAVDARQLLARRQAAPQQPVTATVIYRAMAKSALYAQCRMLPSDSQAFDLRVPVCGAPAAALLGVSRLLLEREATPASLPQVVLEGRLRWLDMPPSRCSP